MKRKEEMSAERRRQILNIALDQFIRCGYFGTSTRQICELAGISSGLLFHYFPTKEALYMELLRMGCAGIRPPEAHEQTPADYFRAEVDRIYGIMTGDESSAKMFVFMSAALAGAAQVSAEAGRLARGCDPAVCAVPVIRQGQTLGQIRSGDPLALASVFYGTLRGIAERHAFCPEETLPDRTWVMDLICGKASRE